MSRYADSKTEDLSFAIDEFLKDHSVGELLEIVADCVKFAEPSKE